MLDALVPGVLVAQAMGRWGNYRNQELVGIPTELPWALEIAPEHRPAGYGQLAAPYVVAYASGRMWIENIRFDPVRFDDIFGLRLIVWVSMAAIAIAGVCLWRLRRKYGAEDDALYRHAAS